MTNEYRKEIRNMIKDKASLYDLLRSRVESPLNISKTRNVSPIMMSPRQTLEFREHQRSIASTIRSPPPEEVPPPLSIAQRRQTVPYVRRISREPSMDSIDPVQDATLYYRMVDTIRKPSNFKFEKEPMGMGGRMGLNRPSEKIDLPEVKGKVMKNLSPLGKRSMSPAEISETNEIHE